MKPNAQFIQVDKSFWANVRTISQTLGYTDRMTKGIRVYGAEDIRLAMERNGLGIDHLPAVEDTLQAYFRYRAEVLNTYVASRLMTAERAEQVFLEIYDRLQPTHPIPMNKQAGDKRVAAYLTGIVNMLIEYHLAGLPCDYNPKRLTTITKDNAPLRTLARQVDGCFPTTVNPIAVWEIKEYYFTTTFGSRVADGVYETLLDGMELEELYQNESIKVQHLLMVDAHYTWWQKGRSYLCRLIDMLHMGYVDEILFGYEVVEQLPSIVNEWVKLYHQRNTL